MRTILRRLILFPALVIAALFIGVIGWLMNAPDYKEIIKEILSVGWYGINGNNN
jgi:hypothetical protein